MDNNIRPSKIDGQRNEDRSTLSSQQMHNASMRESLYAPDPPDAAKRPSVLLTVAGFILVTEFCERLAFYGFAGSLVLFFQVSSNIILNFQFFKCNSNPGLLLLLNRTGVH